MASNKVHLMVTLCSLIMLTTFIGSTQSASCCLRYTKRPLSCKQLIGYTIQTINKTCDISAVIFHLPERFVCANPRMPWTQRAMKCLDEMRRKDDNKQEVPSEIAASP